MSKRDSAWCWRIWVIALLCTFCVGSNNSSDGSRLESGTVGFGLFLDFLQSQLQLNSNLSQFGSFSLHLGVLLSKSLIPLPSSSPNQNLTFTSQFPSICTLFFTRFNIFSKQILQFRISIWTFYHWHRLLTHRTLQWTSRAVPSQQPSRLSASLRPASMESQFSARFEVGCSVLKSEGSILLFKMKNRLANK